MNADSQKPDVFISYNKSDADWVENLAARIESETIDGQLTGRKLSVFFAPWDIGVGQNIVNRINDGLREARFVALIMTPQFFESAWCNLEWTHLISLDPANTNCRIIPLHRKTTALGAPLNAWNWLDFRSVRRWKNSGDQSREVAGPRTTADGGVFWVHQCATVCFKRFGVRACGRSRPYLAKSLTRAFCSDRKATRSFFLASSKSTKHRLPRADCTPLPRDERTCKACPFSAERHRDA